jgi:hypothetical protein
LYISNNHHGESGGRKACRVGRTLMAASVNAMPHWSQGHNGPLGPPVTDVSGNPTFGIDAYQSGSLVGCQINIRIGLGRPWSASRLIM